MHFRGGKRKQIRLPLLCWINEKVVHPANGGVLRNYNSANVAGHNLYFHHLDLPKALEKCLSDFNFGIEQASNLRELIRAIAYFYATFLLRIHPFANGNGRTAKAVVVMLLKQFNVTMASFELVDRYPRTESLETDFLELEKLFWLSVVDIQPKPLEVSQ